MKTSGWHPNHRIGVAEAIRACTATPTAMHRADGLGVIAPGKKADLAVLSKDMLSLAPESIPHVRVEITVFDGRLVHHRF